MKETTPSGGRYVAAFVSFGLLALMAIILFIATLVAWLSELTGSFFASTLIVACFLAILAGAIYLFALRDALEQLRNRFETVYEVARIAQSGYEWGTEIVARLLKLRDLPIER